MQHKKNRWIDRTVHRLLDRFNASEQNHKEANILLRSPRQWLKGDHVDAQQLRPWEKLLWGAASTLRISAAGFDDGRRFLWISHFGVDPRYIFFQTLFNTLWDGITDPLIGQYMDRNPWRDNTYRWIIRLTHTAWRLLYIFFLLDLGFDPVQRLAFFAVAQAVMNIPQTMEAIATQKFTAGITPLTEERSKLFLWEHLGTKLGFPLMNVPQLLMGLLPQHMRAQWNDYMIFTRGFMFAMPLAIAGGIVHTLIKNRVTFEHTKNAEHQHDDKRDTPEKKLTLRESFAVLKHNRFLINFMIANFINQFIPSIDTGLIWRFLVPPIANNFIRGPAMSVLAGQITGFPITILSPFLRRMMHSFGGPQRSMAIAHGSIMLARVGQFFVGLNSPAAMVGFFAFDSIIEIAGPFNNVCEQTMNFEMLDYVEYKTGVRSEGINRSITGFFEKMVKNNIGSFAGNFMQSWLGAHHLNDAVPDETGHYIIPADSQAQRFARYAFPIWMLGDVARNLIIAIARISFPYKYGQHEHIEAELAARRTVEAQVREEMEV